MDEKKIFEKAYGQICTPVVMVNPNDFRVISLNESTEELLGYLQEDLFERSFLNYIDAKDKARILTIFDREILFERIIEKDVTFIRKSGRKLSADVYFHLGQWKNSKVAIITLHDITEIKKSVKKIQLAKEYVENIIESLSEILVVINSEGIIRNVNLTAMRIFGMSKNDLLGSSLSDYIENSHQVLPKILRFFKREKKIVNYPINLHSQKQTKIEVLCSGVVLHSLINNESEMILLFSDISRLREAQREREKAFKMVAQSSKLAALGQLSAGVAHELNNPLAIIQGYVENIELIADNKTVGESQRKLQIKEQIEPIFRAIHRMSTIISNMRSLTTQHNFEMVRFDLRDILADIIHEMDSKYFKSFGVDLEINIDDEAAIFCDPQKIKQIIINILQNAVHALEELNGDRKIKISCTSITNTQFLSLIIWNNGAPIALEIQDRIFDPFFTTKRVGMGPGLGLSVAYDIMKEHGGRISCISNGSLGTSFILEFPIERNKDLVKQTLLPKRGQVLILESDVIFRKMLSGHCAELGFYIVETRTGQEALQLLRKEQFDYLITEFRNPSIDGQEVIAASSILYPNLKIVIIVESERDKDFLTSFSHRIPIWGVLEKPFNEEKFSQLFTTQIHSKKAVG